MTKTLIAVVGPTANGKTGLGIDLVQRYGGEIIGADSRQVYRHMDIGTAKPTAEERSRAAHHLVDIVDPDEPFSLGQWLDLAKEALDDVWARGRQPILVGGTGQYVWSLIEGWRVPRVAPQQELREEPRILFAGQIVGVEGYLESSTSGLIAGLTATSKILGKDFDLPPPTTAIGALLSHISTASPKGYQPMNINWGLFPPLGGKTPKKKRREEIRKRALSDIQKWIGRYLS